MKNPARFFLIFALFWSLIVVLFDGFIAYAFINQIRSVSYVSVPGHIISSEITKGSDSEGGTTYGAKVVYEYEVAGRRHHSERVRFGQGSESSGRWAHATLKAFPAGAERPVYYDPVDPSRSVLQTGVQGQDWFLALFLTPFNVVMIFLWAMVVKSSRPSPPHGGVSVSMEPGRLLVSMEPMPRAGLVLMVIGGLSFVGIFALAIPFGFSPPSEWVWLVWGITAGAAVYVACKNRKPAGPFVIIDAGQGVLSLPQGRFTAMKNWAEWREWKKAGRPPFSIPLERIRSVAACERVSDSSDGKSRTYVVAVSVEDSQTASLSDYDLGSWMLPDRAEAFAAWLRETLSLPAPGTSR